MRLLPATLLVLLGLALTAPAAAEGRFSLTAHLGSTQIDREQRDDGDWWTDIDDRVASFGLSLGYQLTPNLGLRLGYERANELRAANLCPPGDPCPLIAITEDQDFTAWQLAILPRLPLVRNWSLFGIVGVMDWKLSRDDLLPGGSDTTLVYGLGISWRTGITEFGLEYQRADVDYDGLRFNAGVRF